MFTSAIVASVITVGAFTHPTPPADLYMGEPVLVFEDGSARYRNGLVFDADTGEIRRPNGAWSCKTFVGGITVESCVPTRRHGQPITHFEDSSARYANGVTWDGDTQRYDYTHARI